MSEQHLSWLLFYGATISFATWLALMLIFLTLRDILHEMQDQRNWK